MSIARRAFVGALWASGANYLSQGVGFISVAILGRLLLEEDFGLLGTANAIIQFTFILSAFSLNLSIIQSQEEHEHLFGTAFVLNIGLSLVSLILTGISVLVYQLFRDLSHLEMAVVFSLAIANVFNLFGQLFDAILQRKLEFKKTSSIAFLMNLGNPFVAVLLAFLGAGVWSLVAGQVAAGMIFMMGGYLFAGWRVNLAFSWSTAKWFFQIGKSFLGSRSLEVVYTELDRLVIKSMNSYVQVGIYDRAVMASRYPARVVTPAIINVAFPVYSRLKQDTQQLSEAYALVNYFLVRVLLPFGLIFSLIPDYFMVAVLGEKWIHSAAVLRVLSFYAVLHPMVENYRVLLYSLGKPEEVAKVRLIQILFFIPVLVAFVSFFGIIGAAWALLLSILITYVIFAIRTAKDVEAGVTRELVIPVLVTILTAAAFILLPLPILENRILGLLLYSVIVVAIFLFLDVLFEGKTLMRHLRYFRGLLRSSEEQDSTENHS
ncbi:MAG: oligosaccharide flippase family protein [Bacteroidetes bacterium]|nr:oligosaccharide flippase family protein [Bacteroidota bacterium]